jgi:TonB family protein
MKSFLVICLTVSLLLIPDLSAAQCARSGVFSVRETYYKDLHRVSTCLEIEKPFDYPELAYKKRIEGKVRVRFMVDSLCRVSQVTIKKGLGYGLDEIAIDMVKNLQMESYYNGKKQHGCGSIKGYREVGIDFKIDN